jgi:DNA-binding CsgD family transcriptional regulator
LLRRLVGRGPELALVGRFLAGCGTGVSGLVIEGEPGVGKTALFEAALAAVPDGLTVLRVRCVEAESALAYIGLADLLGGRLPGVLPALGPPRRRALEVALLRADAGSDGVEPHVVGWAVLDVLSVLAESGPVLLALDDAQWLDQASARAVSFALRRLDPVPVGVLVTCRDMNGLGVVSPQMRLDRIVLGPLDRVDVELMLTERFDDRLLRSLLSEVVAAAAGNPMYAIELAAAQLVAQEPRSLAAPLTLPPGLEELLVARLGRLPAAAAQPLAAVASLATPTVASVVAALGAEARAGLDCALDEGVLLVAEGRLWFTHPLLGMAALKRLAPSVRRALHARLAACSSDEEERGRHLVLSADGPDAATAQAVERAADLARVRGAPGIAAQLAEAAARLTPPGYPADLSRRRVAAGYHWVMAGDVGRGRAQMATALAGTPPGPARAELLWRTAMLTHLDGDLGEAVRLLEAALVESGDNPVLAGNATRRLAGLYQWLGRYEDSLRCWRTALESARALGDLRGELETLTTYVTAAVLTDTIAPSDLERRIEALAATLGPFSPHEDPEGTIAVLRLLSGDVATAVAIAERLYRRAVECGEEMTQAAVSMWLVGAYLADGRWQRARDMAREVSAAARYVGIVRSFGMDLHAVALVEAHLGNVDAARSAALVLVELAERRGLVPVQLQARTILGFLALSCGDARGAHAEFGAVLDRVRQLGIREWGLLYPVHAEVDALVELGELDRAETLIDEIRSHGQAYGRALELTVAARGRAMVLAARGNLVGAQTELEQLLADNPASGSGFERARTLLTLGGVLRRAKQKRAAREVLGQAQAVFDQLGARLWSAMAAAELSRLGGRAPGTGSLTPTERHVAQLVAQGHTNTEVAALLFLSAKTVATHLTHVYAKLGVRSRSELAAVWPTVADRSG